MLTGMIKWHPFNTRPPCRANCWLGSKHAANRADLVCEQSWQSLMSRKCVWEACCPGQISDSSWHPEGNKGSLFSIKPWSPVPDLWLCDTIPPIQKSSLRMPVKELCIKPDLLHGEHKRVKLYHWGDGYKILCDQFWCRNLRSCLYA